jgi:aconitate hydratase
LDYLRQTNRDEAKINIIEQYLKATNQFREYDNESQDPIYSKVVFYLVLNF